MIDADHPEWGRVRQVGFPWDFSGTPAEWRKQAPKLGEHTEEILLELGYRREVIAQLKASGAIL
jgi:crotonobetainyl-CoA:carnitine CoA-transferase CaiB-like acyl-CoA transferase